MPQRANSDNEPCLVPGVAAWRAVMCNQLCLCWEPPVYSPLKNGAVEAEYYQLLKYSEFRRTEAEMCARVWTRAFSPHTTSSPLSPLGNFRSLCKLQTRCFTYKCDVEAEPIDRYRPGGYHPIELGQVLKNGRSKILHKIGWGGFSTTWAATDQW